MALHRLAAKKASQADRQLLASVITDDIDGHYLIEFNRDKRTVLIGRGWNPETEKYYTASCFYLPDVFQGLQN